MADYSRPSLAVIGAGYWGKNLVRNFHQLGALAAVVETDPERRAATAAAYPGVQIFDAPGAALSDPGISAVAIATPAETHGDLVSQALKAGKHVFVEKPVCLDLQVGMELVRQAEEARLTLMVGHLLHYHPAVVRLKEMVAGGQLGRLQYIYSNRLNLGKFRQEENILWSFAPHDISVILALAGEMPEHVTSYGANLSQKRVADVTVSTLDFPSGVGAHIFVNWLHPFKEQKLVVVGSLGMVVFDDTAPERKLLYYPQPVKYLGGITPVPEKVEPQVITLEKAEPLKNECAHFLECVATGLIPITDGREGLRVLRVLDRCQQGLNMTSELARPGMNEMGLRQEGVFSVHPTAVVDQDCAIGQGTKIWHFSHVLSGSRIGDNCNIGQNVVIGPKAQVGNGCKIQNNVSVYQGVILRDNVFCGPSMVFTNVINPRAHVSRKHEYLNTVVEEGASLGANCTIVCGHTVGRYAFVGAGAVVTKDVPDHALVVGNPAKIKGWMCSCGVRLHFDEDHTACKACGSRYVMKDGRVSAA
jgi:UDP-2-acetamido-3-amino-2,3-dideoxy-glucuronate N-acetyltransferase